MIPAAGILLARRLSRRGNGSGVRIRSRLAVVALVASGSVSLWVAKADTDWANCSREAARILGERVKSEKGAVWFQGHWGFQYYMQRAGVQPFDFEKCTLNAEDVLIIPLGNVQFHLPPKQFSRSAKLLEIELHQPLATMRWQMGAGFYSSYFGPLPFAFGSIDPERYCLFRITTTMQPEDWPHLAAPPA